MNTHIGNIIDAAKEIGAESNRQVERYFTFKEYIEPLVNAEFELNFDISYRSMVRQEIQDFIDQKETEFLK